MLYYILLLFLVYSPATFASFALGTNWAMFHELIQPFSHDDASNTFEKLLNTVLVLAGVITAFVAITTLKKKPTRSCQNYHIVAALSVAVSLYAVTRVNTFQGFLASAALLGAAAFGTQVSEVVLRDKIVRTLYDVLLPKGNDLESKERPLVPTRMAGFMTSLTYLYLAYVLSSIFYTVLGFFLGKDIVGELVVKFLEDETTEQYYQVMAVVMVFVVLLTYLKYKLSASTLRAFLPMDLLAAK